VIDKLCYWFFGWWDKQCQAIDELTTFKFPKPKKIKKPLNKNECPTCHKDFGCQCED
jgi:hypothetical protein